MNKSKVKIQNEVYIENNKLKKVTFKDCVNIYIKDHLPKLRHSSQRNILKVCHRYFLKGPLIKIPMDRLQSSHIDRWLQWAMNHRSRAQNRISFKIETLRLANIFNWWKNYIDPDFKSPVLKRHRQKGFEKTAVYKKRRVDYFMRPQDVKNWLNELQGINNPVYYRLGQFMVLTGARVSEACGLKWSEVNFEERCAYVVRTVDWDSKGKTRLLDITKTESSRRILLLPEKLVRLLKVLREENLHGSLVFSSSKDKPLKYSTIRWAFNRSFKICGLPWRGTHICRHTYATMALIATHSLPAVGASLGHKDLSMTQRYAKSVALLSSNMAEKTAQLYESRSFSESLLFGAEKRGYLGDF